MEKIFLLLRYECYILILNKCRPNQFNFLFADNINGIPRGSTIPPFYVKLIRNYNYFLNDHLFSENSSFYMDISRQDRYERSLKDFKRSSLNGYYNIQLDISYNITTRE